MADGVALMGGAVLPEARGRGVYRALVHARWQYAAARGTRCSSSRRARCRRRCSTASASSGTARSTSHRPVVGFGHGDDRGEHRARRQIVEDAKRYVLYSWSVQDQINPIAGRARRRPLLLGLRRQSLPRLRVAARERLDRPLAPEGGRRRSRTRRRSSRRSGRRWRPSRARASGKLLTEVTPATCRCLLHPRRRGGERERDQARPLVHRPPQDHRALPQLSRRDRRRDDAHRRPAPLARRARASGRRADARSVHVSLPGRASRPVPGLQRRAAPRGDPPVRGRAHRRRGDPRDGHRHERRDRPARRLPAVDPRDLRPARDPADLRRGDGGLRPHRQVVRRRQLGRRARPA